MKRIIYFFIALILVLLTGGCSKEPTEPAEDDTTPPARITDLSIDSATLNSLTLSWTAPGSDGTSGTALEYDIRYTTSAITGESAWAAATQASGEPTPKSAGNTETFDLSGLGENTTYYVAIKAVDETGNWSELSNCPSVTTLFASNVWTTGAPMPTARSSAVAGVINGKLYVAGGGSDAPGYLNVLEVYDPVSDTWATKAPLPTLRAFATAGVINGKLYIVGGEAYEQATPTYYYTSILEVYDPDSDTWTTKAPMPTARCYATAEVIGGKLYVVGGGIDAPGYVNVLEVYDPVSDTWTAKVPMPTAREGAAAGVIDGKLYVAGGRIDGWLDVLEVYDPVSDTWTTKAPMPTARCGPGGVIDGRLYVAGGQTYGWSDSDVLEVYDPVSDTWTTKVPMSTARIGAVAGVIDGRLHVVGGFSTTLFIPLATLEIYTP